MIYSAFKKQVNLKIEVGLNFITHLSKEATTGRNSYDFDVFLPSIGKNLQRPLVWSLLQKQQLIFSVLKGNPIGNISVIIQHEVNGNFSNHFEVIDGKQRLTTLFSFVKNEFPIEWNGKEYFFQDLDKEDRYTIESVFPKFNIVHAYPDEVVSDEQKIAWFEMINFSGTPQEAEHLSSLKNGKHI